jgi:chaperonin GroES
MQDISKANLASLPGKRRGRKAKGNGKSVETTVAPAASEWKKPVELRTVSGPALSAIVNLSGIRATEFNVVVKPVEVEEKTAGGILIPELAKDRMQQASVEGVIVHVSPLAFTYERWPEGSAPPKVGDSVVFAKFAGMIRKGKDGAEYRIVKDKDIAAVLE